MKECCEQDSDTALVLLEAANMSCLNGDLRNVIFNGNKDYIFKIPNFCICDPLFERDYDEIKTHEDSIEIKNINIIIEYILDTKETKEIKIEEITNKTSVNDIKKKFAEKASINIENFKIRFFYKGFELLDENLLWYDNIENHAKIKSIIIPI